MKLQHKSVFALISINAINSRIRCMLIGWALVSVLSACGDETKDTIMNSNNGNDTVAKNVCAGGGVGLKMKVYNNSVNAIDTLLVWENGAWSEKRYGILGKDSVEIVVHEDVLIGNGLAVVFAKAWHRKGVSYGEYHDDSKMSRCLDSLNVNINKDTITITK